MDDRPLVFLGIVAVARFWGRRLVRPLAKAGLLLAAAVISAGRRKRPRDADRQPRDIRWVDADRYP